MKPAHLRRADVKESYFGPEAGCVCRAALSEAEGRITPWRLQHCRKLLCLQWAWREQATRLQIFRKSFNLKPLAFFIPLGLLFGSLPVSKQAAWLGIRSKAREQQPFFNRSYSLTSDPQHAAVNKGSRPLEQSREESLRCLFPPMPGALAVPGPSPRTRPSACAYVS